MAARLGKRERDDKRALIKGNLANLSQMERTPHSMGSYLNRDHMLARTHVGFRDAQNMKGMTGHNPHHGEPGHNARMADGRGCYVAKR